TEPAPATPRVPLSPFDDLGQGYKHSVELDSLTGRVVVRDSVFGEELSQPQTLTLDEFLARRQAEQEERMWQERAHAYQLSNAPTQTKDDLEKILGKGTQIDIPIPQNPISTLFGPPTISINVNGSVNVSAGWQWDNNNLTTISSLGSTQSAPFFDQNIQ